MNVRRQVVRSLKDQLRQGYNISVAELDEAVLWQSATIGVVALSRSRDYLHGLVEEVERAARRILNEHGAELADSFWDYIENSVLAAGSSFNNRVIRSAVPALDRDAKRATQE